LRCNCRAACRWDWLRRAVPHRFRCSSCNLERRGFANSSPCQSFTPGRRWRPASRLQPKRSASFPSLPTGCKSRAETTTRGRDAHGVESRVAGLSTAGRIFAGLASGADSPVRWRRINSGASRVRNRSPTTAELHRLP
jgi:hypothetical protein